MSKSCFERGWILCLNTCDSLLRRTGSGPLETSLNHSLKTEQLLSLKFKVEGKVQSSNLLGF